MIYEDLSKSLHSLVKYNDGLWKSEKQAKFLLKFIKNYSSSPGSLVFDWASSHTDFDPATDFVLFMKFKLKQFGKINISKVRYAGFIFVVDPHGVKVRAKASVNHPSASNPDANFEFGGKATINFNRSSIGSISIDIREEERSKERERLRKVKKNQPMIDKIKSISDWEDKDILVSFVDQLERGYELSLKQNAVVQRMLPQDEMELGDADAWESLVPEVLSLMTKKLIPVFISAWKDFDVWQESRGKDLTGPNPKEMKASWGKLVRNPATPEKLDWSINQDILDTFEELSGGRLRHYPGSHFSFDELPQVVLKAADKLRRRKR